MLAVVLGFVTYGVTQGRQASRQNDAAASRQLINDSEDLGDASPVISRLESIAAWAINPSSNARYAMLAAAARPGIAVLAGHGSPVQAIAFSPGGRLLAVIDNDHSLQLWDVATRQPLGGPLAGAVNSAAFSPDGTLLAAGGSDHTVRLWNAATRQPVGAPLTGHTGAVESVAFSPDGTMLASSGDDHTVRLWDVATRQPVGAPLTGHTGLVDSVAFSPDGTMLASGGFDGTVRLWDVPSGRPTGPTLTAPAGLVDWVQFGLDQKTLSRRRRRQMRVRVLGRRDPVRPAAIHSRIRRASAPPPCFSPNGTPQCSGSYKQRPVRLSDLATPAPHRRPVIPPTCRPSRDKIAFRPQTERPSPSARPRTLRAVERDPAAS